MHETDHVHPKWAQLAPVSIQYQASSTEELFHTEADPENELGGGQFRGSGDRSLPAWSRGGVPVGGLGDEVPQNFRS